MRRLILGSLLRRWRWWCPVNRRSLLDYGSLWKFIYFIFGWPHFKWASERRISINTNNGIRIMWNRGMLLVLLSLCIRQSPNHLFTFRSHKHTHSAAIDNRLFFQWITTTRCGALPHSKSHISFHVLEMAELFHFREDHIVFPPSPKIWVNSINYSDVYSLSCVCDVCFYGGPLSTACLVQTCNCTFKSGMRTMSSITIATTTSTTTTNNSNKKKDFLWKLSLAFCYFFTIHQQQWYDACGRLWLLAYFI